MERWPVFRENRHNHIYWLESQEQGKRQMQKGGVREGTRFGSGKHVINSRGGDRSSFGKSASGPLWSTEREGAGRYKEIGRERAQSHNL